MAKLDSSMDYCTVFMYMWSARFWHYLVTGMKALIKPPYQVCPDFNSCLTRCAYMVCNSIRHNSTYVQNHHSTEQDASRVVLFSASRAWVVSLRPCRWKAESLQCLLSTSKNIQFDCP